MRDAEILTTSDVARMLEVSPDWVRRLARAGHLPALRTRSGQRLFWVADVQRWARQRVAKRHSRESVDAGRSLVVGRETDAGKHLKK